MNQRKTSHLETFGPSWYGVRRPTHSKVQFRTGSGDPRTASWHGVGRPTHSEWRRRTCNESRRAGTAQPCRHLPAQGRSICASRRGGAGNAGTGKVSTRSPPGISLPVLLRFQLNFRCQQGDDPHAPRHYIEGRSRWSAGSWWSAGDAPPATGQRASTLRSALDKCRKSADSWGFVIRMYYRDHPPPHFHAE